MTPRPATVESASRTRARSAVKFTDRAVRKRQHADLVGRPEPVDEIGRGLRRVATAAGSDAFEIEREQYQSSADRLLVRAVRQTPGGQRRGLRGRLIDECGRQDAPGRAVDRQREVVGRQARDGLAFLIDDGRVYDDSLGAGSEGRPLRRGRPRRRDGVLRVGRPRQRRRRAAGAPGSEGDDQERTKGHDYDFRRPGARYPWR